MELRSILAVPCECENCLWAGLTGACEADGEGCLCCPECGDRVQIDYNEHERNPTGRIEPANR